MCEPKEDPLDALFEAYCDAGQLGFAPVPVRARHDGWTAARQRAFIVRLALCGSVGKAARAVGMTREGAYRLRGRAGAEGFAAVWDKALGWGESRMIDIGIEHAILGETVPIYYRGRQVGERRRYNAGLVIAALNAAARRAR